MAFLASLFGNPEEKLLQSWKPLIGRINAFEPLLENLSPAELKEKTDFLTKVQTRKCAQSEVSKISIIFLPDYRKGSPKTP